MLPEFSVEEREKLTELIDKIKKGEPLGLADPQPMIAALEKVLESLELLCGDKYKIHDSDGLCLVGRLKDLYTDGIIPEEEKKMVEALDKLANEWESDLKKSVVLKASANLFNMDGFYPFYTTQPCRILFVGREACWMSGKNYIHSVCKCLRANDFSGWTVNQYPFHRRQFYIAYGIMRWCKTETFPEWENVPYASNMAQNIFAQRNSTSCVGDLTSISWAFINLSKLSNDTGDYRTDSHRYYPFVSDEFNKKKLQEQIKILEPKIIIGANVPELASILDYGAPDTEVGDCYYYAKGKDFPPFLNCYHFAAIKSDDRCFYNPIKEVFEQHCGDLKMIVNKNN